MRRHGSPFTVRIVLFVRGDCGRNGRSGMRMAGLQLRGRPFRGKSMLLRILDRLEEILIATLMALATLIIFVAVMHRYLDRHSLAVSDPVSDQPVLGAGTVHLHVRVGGQVRRGLWRAHRHPCRRRRRGEPAQVALAQCGRAVRPVLRRVLHRRDRHHGREIRLRPDATPTRSRPTSRSRAGSSISAFRSAPI